jgi:TonB family protein
MRGSLIGSTTVHVALLLALFLVAPSAPISVPGPDVVQGSLIDPAMAQTIAAPTPTREPEQKVPEIKPIDETGVKITPPKPPKKKQQEPDRREPQPAAAALPYAPVEAAGLRGQVAVDAADFEFTYYLLQIRNRIAGNWTPPAGLTTGHPVHAVVVFRIGRGGDVTGIQIEERSNVDYFDRAAIRAVTISAPLPPLPLGYSGYDLGVHFGFEYSGP